MKTIDNIHLHSQTASHEYISYLLGQLYLTPCWGFQTGTLLSALSCLRGMYTMFSYDVNVIAVSPCASSSITVVPLLAPCQTADGLKPQSHSVVVAYRRPGRRMSHLHQHHGHRPWHVDAIASRCKMLNLDELVTLCQTGTNHNPRRCLRLIHIDSLT